MAVNASPSDLVDNSTAACSFQGSEQAVDEVNWCANMAASGDSVAGAAHFNGRPVVCVHAWIAELSGARGYAQGARARLPEDAH